MTIPPGWEIYDFPKTLIPNRINRTNQINASDIKPSGRYPVIDQGQEYIAGYSDEDKRLYKPEQPLVIFGDHTRCFKYVDFPFIIGADGTKALVPNAALFNPKFFYFYLLSLRIPSRGYNRHFKLLKEQNIFRPPIPEQEKIVHIFSQLQSAIETQAKIIRVATKLKKALTQKLFAEGLLGEKQKQTRLGLIPANWQVVPLIKIVNFTTGKLNANAAKKDGAYPFFTCSQEISKIDSYAFDMEAILLSGNNARAIYSVKYYKGKFDAYQRTYVISIKDTSIYDYRFLQHILEFNLEKLRQISMGTSTKYLTLGLLENLLVVQPDLNEQKTIANSLVAFDEKIQNSENRYNLLKNLFQSMLHQLMAGQIRVNDLNISVN